MESVTEAQLFQALQDALVLKDGEDGTTTAELVEATGMTVSKILKALGRLKKDGKLEHVRVMRETIDGRTHPRPGYRLKDNP